MRHAEEAERNFKGFKNIEKHPYCVMARNIWKGRNVITLMLKDMEDNEISENHHL